MNILCVDAMGQGLDWCLRCLDAGHTVKWFMPPSMSRTGMNLVSKVESWQAHMKWADLVFVTDNAFYVAELQKFIDDGFPVFGPNLLGTRLELDREKGQQALKQCGVRTIPYECFDSYEKAKAYVVAHPKRYVSKPSGNADKALSYCAKKARDLYFMLGRWQDTGKIKSSFMLQKFVPGVEMGVGTVMTRNGFSQWKEENFEFKKFMAGDIGVNTGEQGTVMRFVKESKLFDDVLKPLEHYLHRIGYIGFVDLNCIIDGEGRAWPLEFTCRPGWPAFQIQQELQRGDPAQWMLDAIHGEDTMKFSEDIAVGVVVTMPDYPFSKMTRKETVGFPIWGITKENMPHVHLAEAYAGKAPDEIEGKIFDRECFLTAGDYVYVASGSGKTVADAKKAAYKIVDDVDIPNSQQYRPDIGDRLKKQLPLIQKHGYAKGMRHSDS